MSLDRLLNQPLSLQRVAPGNLDAYGNVVGSNFGDPVIVYGFLEQVSTLETEVDRDTTVTQWKAFLPNGTVIGPLDRISYNGATFEVIGAPATWYNPRIKLNSHLTVALRSVIG
jgi:hypothetical protein